MPVHEQACLGGITVLQVVTGYLWDMVSAEVSSFSLVNQRSFCGSWEELRFLINIHDASDMPCYLAPFLSIFWINVFLLACVDWKVLFNYLKTTNRRFAVFLCWSDIFSLNRSSCNHWWGCCGFFVAWLKWYVCASWMQKISSQYTHSNFVKQLLLTLKESVQHLQLYLLMFWTASLICVKSLSQLRTVLII